MVNLSADPSTLPFPRATPLTAAAHRPVQHKATAVAAALAQEKAIGYYVLSGEYWKSEHQFDPTRIDALDAMWRAAIPQRQ